MQKGSVQLLLLLFLILIAGAIFFYQSRGKQTVKLALPTAQIATKNTYFSPLGFQLQYANGLTVKEDSEEEFNQRGNGDFRKNFRGYVGYEPGKFLDGVIVLDKDGSYEQNPLTLWIFDNPDDLSIDRWFDKYWYYPFLWGVFDYDSKEHVALDQEATVSGVMAKHKVVSYQQSSPKYVYLSKEKKMYLFRIIGESGNKILSSFIFTN